MENSRMKELVPRELLRDVPGWKDAPVPACMGGDPRSLTFCCHPGFSLTFSFKCRRDALLEQVGLDKEEFVKIKDEFSSEHHWDDARTCFGSLSYCCMRRGGCPGGRDHALVDRYDGGTWDDVLEEYFSLKRELAIRLLRACRNRDLVEPFLSFEDTRRDNEP